MNQYWVYIMMSLNNHSLYIGVTNDVERRVREHKLKINPKAFTTLYNCVKLVHLEDYNRVEQAIAREKQLKNWHRDWKLNLIKEENPEFRSRNKFGMTPDTRYVLFPSANQPIS